MTEFSRHGEWLSLIDVSGPFLAEPVLKRVFPQGLEQTDPLRRKHVRQAYDEWREAVDTDDPQFAAIHEAWIGLVLKKVLELDEEDEEDALKPESELPKSLTASFPEHDATLRPDFAVVDAQNDNRPLMFVAVYAPDTELSAPAKGGKWAASPAERMVELCLARDVRLGLVTNGEHWMLVDAPVGGVTSFASWYARLWGQEPITLQAFVNLLGIRRFFVDDSERLPALLDESLKLQDEVTDALGEQVRRAVEVLVQALDRADVDRNRVLLTGVEPPELYEAALTVLMRIVFLLSAEERGLLLLDDEKYQEYYAVSTLRMQLRAESEEILERRQDAWSRLLAIFRAIFGGIDHDALKLPPLGGSLFDPDRFPFLEGRAKGTSWKKHPAAPLPIDNRTVLLLLDAVQLFEGRTLSYRALDIEQIGYVYEGLLERTVIRAREVTLDLDATRSAKTPWVTLDELENAASEGEDAVRALLRDRTGSSLSRVKNDLAKQIDEAATDRLLTACHGDQDLRDRIKPYLKFLRMDRWGYPLVYPEGTFMVTAGADRRETGTHYTPKSLTEAVVKETLEPLVYVGSAEGKPREEWTLRPPGELLGLKVCDPAMGSGAFLVQVCRWLSERLVEAWSEAEATGRAITAEGEVVDEICSLEPLRGDAEDRLLKARRLIAERCLYGVDMNPLAVELAKLSIWLITLAKGRPFGFLDHNLRCGDSLLGIHDLDQLLYLNMAPGMGSSKRLFAAKIDAAVERALELRTELRGRPIRDIRDIKFLASLDERARQELKIPFLIADAFIGETFAGAIGSETIALSIESGKAIDDPDANAATLVRRARNGLRTDLPAGMRSRQPFHWPLEFPEVFERESAGFDAVVGNPPFITGKRISTHLTEAYQGYLKHNFENSKGAADLCVYFLRRGFQLIRANAQVGMIATKSVAEGDSRLVGTEYLQAQGATIYWAIHELPWPGKANVTVSLLALRKGLWQSKAKLNGRAVSEITSRLTTEIVATAHRLSRNKGTCSDGIKIQGDGFIISEEERLALVASDERNNEIIRPYITGIDITQGVGAKPSAWIIHFGKMSERDARTYKEVFAILEERVKAYRDSLTGQIHEKDFWRFWDKREKFFESMKSSDGILACPSTAKYLIMTFLNLDWIPSHSIKLFAFDDFASFSVMQSAIHEVWARFQSGKLDQRLAYNLSRAFGTFPWPKTSPNSDYGEKFWQLRKRTSLNNNICFTDLYNALHDKDRQDTEFLNLRNLIEANDNVVLSAYGWNDLALRHDFYAVPYLPEADRIRFTMSEEARLEVLQRLTELNRKSYAEEQRPKSQRRNDVPTHVGRTSGSASISSAPPDLFSSQVSHVLADTPVSGREESTTKETGTSSDERGRR